MISGFVLSWRLRDLEMLHDSEKDQPTDPVTRRTSAKSGRT
jgi:hypothetical protein